MVLTPDLHVKKAFGDALCLGMTCKQATSGECVFSVTLQLLVLACIPLEISL